MGERPPRGIAERDPNAPATRPAEPESLGDSLALRKSTRIAGHVPITPLPRTREGPGVRDLAYRKEYDHARN